MNTTKLFKIDQRIALNKAITDWENQDVPVVNDLVDDLFLGEPSTDAPQPVSVTSKNELRPMRFADVVGQEKVKSLLKRMVDAALARKQALGHVLLLGPSGTGKTTLAGVIANEMQRRMYHIEAPVSHETLLKLREVMKDGDVLLLDEALALDTPVPTPNGWTTIGSLHPGDEVFGVAGSPVKVTALTPIAHDHACYRVTFVDGESIVTDAGHKWFAAPKVASGTTYLHPRAVTTDEMVQSGRSWRIPNPSAVELPEAVLPMDPYLLGQWLGNGNVGQVYVNVRPELGDAVLTRAQESYPEARFLDDVLPSGLLRLSLGRGRGGPWGVKHSTVRKHLTQLNIWDKKAIPGIYLRGSIAQRLDLLRGLMDTEGYLNPQGHATFSNTNTSILNGVVELLRSLGYMPSLRPTKPTELTRTPCWKVQFRPTPDRNPFLLREAERVVARKYKDQRRIVSIHSVAPVPVRCVEIDSSDHLFLVGRGMVPTHNCHQQAIQERRGKSSSTQPEVLFSLLEDFTIPTQAGLLDFPRITVIGASTDPGLLPAPFLNRFPVRPRLAAYSNEDMATIARANARALSLTIDPAAVDKFACASRSVPRELNNLLRNAASLTLSGHVDAVLADEVIHDLNGLTSDGLTDTMQAVLVFLLTNGKRVTRGEVRYQASVSTLATGCGLARDQKAIQLHVEPTLIERGYLQVAHGGRVLTDAGVERAQSLAVNGVLG